MGRVYCNGMNKTETKKTSVNFTSEKKATRYHNARCNGLGFSPEGLKVISNEIEYNKDGTFTVTTVYVAAK